MSEMIRFESRRVGEIVVPEKDVLHFDPLPGFPERRRYVVMGHAADSELAWLVSLDDADLAFVVASPWSFFPSYDPPVEREHLAALEIERRDDVEILCLVTLSGRQIYLNLAAPLLANVVTRRGLQVMSDDPRYTTRAAIPSLRGEGAGNEEAAASESAQGAAPR